MLLVGNHSGGNLTPDTTVFTLAFSTYFGVERRFHQLAHNLVLSAPGLGFLRKYGTVAATPANAERALDQGAALLVYPGGDYEVHRPSWESAVVDFDGRKGFIRLAKQKRVPIVPVVSVGGQETALFLSRGEGLARLLGLDRMFRLKVLPISLSLPWVVNVGDMLGHIPLPAKITVEVLEPIDVGELEVDEAYDIIIERMQRTPHRAPGRPPPAGARMRIEKTTVIDAARGRGLGADRGPVHLPALHGAARRRCRRKDDGPERGAGARYTVHLRVGSAEVGGLVEIVEFDEPADLAWTSVTGIDQRLRWRLRETDDSRTRVTLRLAYDAPGGVLGAVADQVSKPMVASNLERTLHNLKAEIEGGSDEVSEGMSIPGRVAYQLGSVKILIDAGVVRPMRPDRLLKFVQTLMRWGRSPAAGSIALADRFPNETAIVDELGTLTFSEVHRAQQRARALAVRPRRRGGRRRRDHVPQPPRLRRVDLRRVEARRQLALPQHRLRRAAADRGRRARAARRRSSTTRSSPGCWRRPARAASASSPGTTPSGATTPPSTS